MRITAVLPSFFFHPSLLLEYQCRYHHHNIKQHLSRSQHSEEGCEALVSSKASVQPHDRIRPGMFGKATCECGVGVHLELALRVACGRERHTY